jgi:alkylated DNA repair dioxygenase AlkB
MSVDLGPYTTIVSLSLGVTRNFRLRDTPGSAEIPRTYEIPLTHNSVIIMHGGTQEWYKHSIPPVAKGRAIDLYKPAWTKDGQFIPAEDRVGYNSRINVTFRCGFS